MHIYPNLQIFRRSTGKHQTSRNPNDVSRSSLHGLRYTRELAGPLWSAARPDLTCNSVHWHSLSPPLHAELQRKLLDPRLGRASKHFPSAISNRGLHVRRLSRHFTKQPHCNSLIRTGARLRDRTYPPYTAPRCPRLCSPQQRKSISRREPEGLSAASENVFVGQHGSSRIRADEAHHYHNRRRSNRNNGRLTENRKDARHEHSRNPRSRV